MAAGWRARTAAAAKAADRLTPAPHATSTVRPARAAARTNASPSRSAAGGTGAPSSTAT
jgi:hypothetical protein